MFCAISGETPENPVLYKKSGHIFERRLIEKHLKTHENKCPITGEELTEEDLIPVKVSGTVKPRPSTATSLPSLIATFQNEWDALMLESFSLKKELENVKKELSHALYQHDAACRVIARLIKERDEARNALNNLQGTSQVSSQSQKQSKVEPMEVESTSSSQSELPEEIKEKMLANSIELSKQRKKRVISPTLSKLEDIREYVVLTSNTMHKTNPPGISCVDINAENNLILTGGVDSNIIVFNRETRKAEATLDGHTKALTSVLFHPTHGNLFFSTSSDNTAKVWKVSDSGYQCSQTIQVHTQSVVGCSVHPLGDYWVTGSEDGSWAFHNLHSSKTLLQAKTDSVYKTISFHPDGLILGSGSDKGVVDIWDVRSKKIATSFAQHKSPVVSLSFNENGFYLCSGSTDGIVHLWDLRKAQSNQIHTFDLSAEKFQLSKIQFDFSGSYLAVAGTNIKVYTVKGYELLTQYSKHSDLVTDVKWGQDASLLVSTSLDRSMKVWSKKETPNKKRKA